MKKQIKYFICTFVLINILTISIINDSAIALESNQNEYFSYSQDVKVALNGELLNFDVQPTIINDRTLVPLRVIFEALGAEVDWDGVNRIVTAKKDGVIISLKIDSKDAYVNQEKKELDVPAMIIDDRTLIPARFISESMGCVVDWEGNSRTVIINSSVDKINTDKEFSFQGIAIGDSEEKVIKALGKPARKDLSKYGFRWYIYNGDYSKYIQVGIKDNKVVGIYTNASNWKSNKGIMIGTPRKEVNSKYSDPLSGIKKGNTIYNLDNSQGDTYLIDDYYTTIFYDIHNGNTVTAVLLIEKGTEEALNSFFGKASDELRKSYEKQIFDLANAVRARYNKTSFIWDDSISNVAREHSQDMADRNYFSHVNLDGKSPFARMEENNLEFMMAAENIAAGQPSAIIAHENWMNSEGHRNNILGDCKELGVGVYFGGTYSVYYTQNFFTPMN